MIDARTYERRGFTMLTVLWVMSVASVATMAGLLAARNAVGSGRNRMNALRASLVAEGCVHRIASATDSVLRASSDPAGAAATWRVLDKALSATRDATECDARFEAAGTRLDVNTVPMEVLERFFTEAGTTDPTSAARSIVAARDSEPFADLRDIARLTFDPGGLAALMTTQPGRVSLATASVPVLLAIPGMTLEAAEMIRLRQTSGVPVADLTEVLGLVSEAASSALLARYADAAAIATADPDAWTVRVGARSGMPSSHVDFDVRLARAARGCRVVRVYPVP